MTPPVSRAAILAVATCRDAPTATSDDGLGLSRLARSGVFVETVPWDAPPGWRRYAAVIIRSAWDYHVRLGPFLRWTEEVERAGVELWNPAAVVRWNSDKRYLRDLERAGVRVVPTEWVAKGSTVDLAGVLRRRRWRTSVVKPSVSATAYRTGRVTAVDHEPGAELLSVILQDSDALIQPFLTEIRDHGEWSFVYFADDGAGLTFSHAVVKRSRPGDFRVQPQFGGTAQIALPPAGVRRQVDDVAAALCRLAPGRLLYARIDGVVSDGAHAPDGTFLLMEAELIEPMLFLGSSDRAADRFADAVARRLGLLTGESA